MLAAANIFAADLTVTGSFPGNSWNNANAEYKMTEIGTTGVYSLEKNYLRVLMNSKYSIPEHGMDQPQVTTGFLLLQLKKQLSFMPN